MDNHRTYLHSSTLARRCGVSTDTLRHYERLGLLHAERSANGYREYPPQALDRVRLVRHALSVGFTLEELARLLKVRDGGGAPCNQVRALAAVKLKALEEQIQGLSVLRSELESIIERWDAKLTHTREGEQARLLEMLAAAAPGVEKAAAAGGGLPGRKAMTRSGLGPKAGNR